MIDIKKFNPGGAPLILNVTTTAATGTFTQTLNTSLDAAPLYDARFVNTGTSGQLAFVSWNSVATTTTGQPLLGNTERTFNCGGYPQVFSAVMAAGSATIYVIPGQGD